MTFGRPLTCSRIDFSFLSVVTRQEQLSCLEKSYTLPRATFDTMTTALPYSLIDTMTATAFTGNPTPVFVLSPTSPWPTDTSLQRLAREMNHSETVFVRSCKDTSSSCIFDILFFTPHAEEPFCGHGIVGAAFALADGRDPDDASFLFRLRNGIEAKASVASERGGEKKSHTTSDGDSKLGSVRQITMEFPPEMPSIPPNSHVIDQIARFAAALQIEVHQIVALTINALDDWVIELDASTDISSDTMFIDPVALLEASPQPTRSQIVTTTSSKPGVDFAKRVFAYGGEGKSLIPSWTRCYGSSIAHLLTTS